MRSFPGGPICGTASGLSCCPESFRLPHSWHLVSTSWLHERPAVSEAERGASVERQQGSLEALFKPGLCWVGPCPQLVRWCFRSAPGCTNPATTCPSIRGLSQWPLCRPSMACLERHPSCCPTGELVVGLFSLVHRLTFTQSCLASIFYVAAAVLVPQGADAHVGTRVQGAAFIIGPLWFGAILAGIMVSSAGLLAAQAACVPGRAHVTLGTSTPVGLCQGVTGMFKVVTAGLLLSGSSP